MSENTNGLFTWTDNSTIDYENWSPSFPKVYSYERCSFIYNKELHIKSCDQYEKPFICQKPLNIGKTSPNVEGSQNLIGQLSERGLKKDGNNGSGQFSEF